jgi:hypothetical protein
MEVSHATRQAKKEQNKSRRNKDSRRKETFPVKFIFTKMKVLSALSDSVGVVRRAMKI